MKIRPHDKTASLRWNETCWDCRTDSDPLWEVISSKGEILTRLCTKCAEELFALEIPKRRYVLKRTYWNASSGNEKCHPSTRDVDFFQVIDVVNLSAQAAGLFCEPCAQAVADALESRR